MTLLLFSVGIFVFFITVYGAVLVGGHAMRDAQAEVTPPDTIRTDAPMVADEPVASVDDDATVPAADTGPIEDASVVALERERAHRLVS